MEGPENVNNYIHLLLLNSPDIDRFQIKITHAISSRLMALPNPPSVKEVEIFIGRFRENGGLRQALDFICRIRQEEGTFSGRELLIGIDRSGKVVINKHEVPVSHKADILSFGLMVALLQHAVWREAVLYYYERELKGNAEYYREVADNYLKFLLKIFGVDRLQDLYNAVFKDGTVPEYERWNTYPQQHTGAEYYWEHF